MNGHNDLGPIQIGSVLWSSLIRVTCLMTSRWLRHRRMRQKWLRVATVVGPIPFEVQKISFSALGAKQSFHIKI